MRAIATLACVVLATLTAGCSSTEADSADATAKPGIVQILRQTASYEYTPYASPRAMRDAVDVAVVGIVEHVAAAVVRDELNGQGALVVALRPTEVWKGVPETRSGLVYFVVPRPNNVGVDVYRTALPKGSRVVMFGVDHAPATDFTTGDPGVTTYVPVPQGLFLYGPAGLENVWAEEAASGDWSGTGSLAGLRAAVLQR
jgi:hypothetical protein